VAGANSQAAIFPLTRDRTRRGVIISWDTLDLGTMSPWPADLGEVLPSREIFPGGRRYAARQLCRQKWFPGDWRGVARTAMLIERRIVKGRSTRHQARQDLLWRNLGRCPADFPFDPPPRKTLRGPPFANRPSWQRSCRAARAASGARLVGAASGSGVHPLRLLLQSVPIGRFLELSPDSQIDLRPVEESVSVYVARRIRTALLLAVGSFVGLVAVRTYAENHSETVSAYPWRQLIAILLIVLWVLALRGLFAIFRLPCPRCRYWIGIPWIAARTKSQIGRCPRCHVRFDQPVKP
jgi:hypothetical protein